MGDSTNHRKFSNKIFLVAVGAILGIALLGFLAGALKPASTLCTELACPCTGVDGERPCNTCSREKPVFVTGIFNIVQTCSGREIIKCRNGMQADTRIDFSNANCTYRFDFIKIPAFIKSFA